MGRLAVRSEQCTPVKSIIFTYDVEKDDGTMGL